MTLMYDDVGTGILGTGGTTELQIGAGSTSAGSALVVPSEARGLLEVIPYQAGNAVVTASESLNTRFRMDSNDVATMIPKIFQLNDIMGGLGATTSHMIPALQAFRCNTPLVGGERINYYAQPITATTTATIVGATAVYSSSGVRGAEQFYNVTGNTTISAPTANSSNAGASLTITGGKLINFIQPHIGSVVMTAAQSYVGVASYTSPDFEKSYPYKLPTQPIGGFLGSTCSPIDSNGDQYGLDEPIMINRAQTVISSTWTCRVAQTGNVNFNTTFGYLK